MFRNILRGIKAAFKVLIMMGMFVSIIGLISLFVADIMIDHRVNEIWTELDAYYEAKYETDKANLYHEYGIIILEDNDWAKLDEEDLNI